MGVIHKILARFMKWCVFGRLWQVSEKWRQRMGRLPGAHIHNNLVVWNVFETIKLIFYHISQNIFLPFHTLRQIKSIRLENRNYKGIPMAVAGIFASSDFWWYPIEIIYLWGFEEFRVINFFWVGLRKQMHTVRWVQLKLLSDMK